MNRRQIDSFYALALSVRRLFHRLGHGIGAFHADSDISAGMRAVLESVIDGGPQSVPHMARVRPVTRQHIQGLVNALIDGGYAAYIDNPAHKRSRLVAPTARGQKAFRQMRAVENQAFERLRLEATAEELEAANKVLRVLIDTFDSPGWRSIVAGKTSRLED
jgi:DNA-binding MarR family transcriptional regulator